MNLKCPECGSDKIHADAVVHWYPTSVNDGYWRFEGYPDGPFICGECNCESYLVDDFIATNNQESR